MRINKIFSQTSYEQITSKLCMYSVYKIFGTLYLKMQQAVIGTI